jgi:hypothetical protein
MCRKRSASYVCLTSVHAGRNIFTHLARVPARRGGERYDGRPSDRLRSCLRHISGIVLTASHNPSEYNTLKLFGSSSPIFNNYESSEPLDMFRQSQNPCVANWRGSSRRCGTISGRAAQRAGPAEVFASSPAMMKTVSPGREYLKRRRISSSCSVGLVARRLLRSCRI